MINNQPYKGTTGVGNVDYIRRIVREELARANKANRFGFHNISNHHHNGNDSPKVAENSLDRNPGVLGSLEFSTVGQTYTIELKMPYTPRRIHCNFIIAGSTVRMIGVGEAYLGEGYYLQPVNSNTVRVGDIRYPAATEQPDGSTKSVPLQCSNWFWANRADNDQYFAAVSENHIVSVSFSGIIYARVTVVDFSKDKIVLSVPYLESGYSVFANFLIT